MTFIYGIELAQCPCDIARLYEEWYWSDTSEAAAWWTRPSRAGGVYGFVLYQQTTPVRLEAWANIMRDSRDQAGEWWEQFRAYARVRGYMIGAAEVWVIP